MINYVTQVPYTGKNAGLLMESGFESPYFMTFRQALSVGRCVRKGETGIQLVRIVKKKVYDEETGEMKTKMVPRRFSVFNLEQTEVSNEESSGEARSEV